ncbi:MAG: hypothetical protein IJC76_08800 [Lachnospiraceae bacterium]|nr:hypothetical protein [Lachnospiraceae bacterium]
MNITLRKSMIEGVSKSLEMLSRVMGVTSEELGELTGIGESGITDIKAGKRLLTTCEYISLCAIIDNFVTKDAVMERTVHAIIAINMDNVNWVQIKSGNLVTKWISTFCEDNNSRQVECVSDLNAHNDNEVVLPDRSVQKANNNYIDLFDRLKASAVDWKEV